MASEWKTDLLGNLCLMKNGYAFKSKDFVSQGIPVIKIKNVKPNRILVDDLSYVPADVAEQRKKWLIEKGEILLTMTGNRADGSPESWVGKAAIFNESTPYLLNQRVSALKAKDEAVIDTNYLGYYLSSWQTQLYFIKRANSSGGQANISPEIVMNMPVHYPPLATQRKIVSILATLDQKIKTNAAINDNLELQAQAFFQELFVDNADPEWAIGTISDLGAVVGGSTPSKAKPEYYTETGIAWITPKDLSINKSKFISHGENDITELGLKNSSATIMPEGTVLFSSRAPIGYIAVAAGEVTTNQGFKSIVPKPEIGTAFVYYFLKHNLPIIEGMASGSTFKEVSGSTMKGVPAVIPDTDTIARFNDFCTPIFAQQRILEEQNQSLAVLRDNLLPKLMSGEIDVSTIQL